MTITTTSLTQAAGLSAAVAGAIFIGVQINHPPMDVASVTTTEWVVRRPRRSSWPCSRSSASPACTCARSAQIGVLGLVGYLVLGAGYLVMLGIEFVGAFVLPTVADTEPGYVNDVIVAAAGGTRPATSA